LSSKQQPEGQGKRGERSKNTKGVLPMNEFNTGWHLWRGYRGIYKRGL